MEEYLSCRRGTASFEIERSVFLSEVVPVTSEEEFQRVLLEIRSKYPDAAHHCWAYLFGAETGIETYRFSDGGEPSGTAGMPILDAIRGRKLNNAAVVVTRYFGGVKLGAGGLCRAYSKSAILAIDGAETVKFERSEEIRVQVSYDLLPRLENFLKSKSLLCEKEFGEQVTLTFCERAGEAERTRAQIRDLSGGRAEAKILGAKFVHYER